MRKLLLSTAIGLTVFIGASDAKAAGFYIQEQSVKGLGYAFSGSVTSIDDASTIYFNAANMTNLNGAQMNAAAHVLKPNADLNNNGSTGLAATGENPGNPYDAEVIPNLFAATPILDGKAWIGAGITAPFGLANDYGETWFGRYDSTSTDLKTIDFQPSVAFNATEWLSVGLGVNVQYADAELKSASRVTSDGISTLRGNDISFGYTASLLAQPNDKLDIGMNYRSGITHELDGSISLVGSGGADFNTSGTATLGLPDIATFGAGYDVNDRFRVMGQATWFGWNNFQNITARNDAGTTLSQVVQNYKTTWAYAIGAEYDVNEEWTVRAGYQYDETPTRDLYRTSRTPDGDRNWFSAGATYRMNDQIDLDLAATYIDISEEKINVSRNSGFAQVSATSEGSVGIVALGMTYKF